MDVGALRGLARFLLLAFFCFCLPLLPSLLPMVSWFRPAATSDASVALRLSTAELFPYQQDHALAAFEQGDWPGVLESSS